MTTEYTLSGRNVFVGNKQDRPMPVEELPVDIYELNLHPDMGYYLTRREPFKIPDKIYGNTVSRVKKFLHTFADRSGTTGILLSGLKGSGKTLEMTMTCVEGLKHGYPVIVVSAAYCGTAFNKFVQSLDQPCIFVLDEFEKVYDDDAQIEFLTLLDGTLTTKKLFLFTCNDRYKVNSHMMNRPGRIFYSIKYEGLDQKFIEDYCNDKLNNKSRMDSIVRVAVITGEFNFDMLQALVQELNRYPDESVRDALSMLNINLDNGGRNFYEIEYYMDGERIKTDDDNIDIYPMSVRDPFLLDTLEVNYSKYIPKEGKKKAENIVKNITFDLKSEHALIARDLSSIELIQDGMKIIIKRPEVKTFSYGTLID
jgi:hypothetical protein